MIAAGALVVAGQVAVAPPATAADCAQTSMYIAAHEDDTLLFMSPALLDDIQAGWCVQTVFVTAGDANRDETYWSTREAGAKAAYATMAGVADTWVDTWETVAGHSVRASVLTGAPDISLVFLRLPEGQAGDGGPAYGYQSIKKLWLDTIPDITAVDNSATYTSGQDLINTLAALMTAAQPTKIVTQDFAGAIEAGDNVDHYVAAYFARAAHLSYSTPHVLLGYLGYGTEWLPANVDGADLTAKKAAFYAYGQHDALTCSDDASCSTRKESTWLTREYLAASESGPPDATPAVNVASSATVTASSQDAAAGQGANKAVDGVVAGYPGSPSNEWATVGGKAGSWLQLGWASPQTLSQVVLYDRPNEADQATGGLLEFSDGSRLGVGALPNDGSPLTVPFIPRSVTSVRFTVAKVPTGTLSVGLAEIEAWSGAGTVVPVTVSAGPDQSVASGASVVLDGSGSDPGSGGALTYAWTQTAGASVALSDPSAVSPSFVAPTGPATLTFQLTVSNSAGSTSDAVSVTVAAPPVAAAGPDQSVASGAAVVLDGSASSPGPGGALTYAWTQTAGATVTLSGASTASPSFVAPTGPATLTFQLTVTNSAGSASDQVSVTVAAPPVVAPVAAAGSDRSVASGAAVVLDGSASSPGSGGALTYAWTQTAGASVVLSGASTASPSFVAPTGPATLTFQLTVSNSAGSASDQVSVTVVAAPLSAVERYITQVYQDLFHRSPDPGGLATWTNALNSGTPYGQVANAITGSPEYRSRLITATYQRYLGRAPEAAGLVFWLGQMNAGRHIEQMQSGFIASDEFYARGGGTDRGWVTLLYQTVLERSPASSEVDGWVSAIRGGMGRGTVALGFLYSTEHLTTVVDGYYVDLLGRHIDPSGRATWVGQIQAGHRDEEIIASIVSSPEYRGKV